MDKKSASLGAAASLLLVGGLFAGITLANANTGSTPAPAPVVSVTSAPVATVAPKPVATHAPVHVVKKIVKETAVTVTPTESPATDPAPVAVDPAPVTVDPAPAPVVAPAPAPVASTEPVAPAPATVAPTNNFGLPQPGDIKNQDKGKQPTDGSTVIPDPTLAQIGTTSKP